MNSSSFHFQMTKFLAMGEIKNSKGVLKNLQNTVQQITQNSEEMKDTDDSR